MKRLLTRASVAGLSAALVAGAALVAAPAASAAQIGALSFTGISAGSAQSAPFSVATSAGCPTTPTNATNFQIRVSNDPSVPGNTANLATPPTAPNIQGNTAGSTIAGGINQAFTAPVSQTLQQFASNNGLAALGQGTYLVELVCRTLTSSATLGEFSGRVVIAANGSVASAGPILQNVATTTVVSAAPASIDTLGSSTFTATVSPASGSAIAGSVQFKVDGVNFGAPVAVNAAGVAVSGSYSSLAAGAKAVSAVFTGGSDATSNYGNSTGSTTLTVTQNSVATSTGLGLSAASVTNGSAVVATATVTNGASPVTVGQVQFKVDGANVGSPIAVNASGVATLSVFKPTGGPYSVTADYLGSAVGGTAFAASTSPAASFSVTANLTPLDTDPQTVTVEVPAGVITINTPYTAASPLAMGPMTLNGVNGFSATATFANITVADTRAGNTAWTAQALSSTFTKGAAGPTETISSNNVGLTGLTFTTNAVDSTATLNLPAGSPNAATNFSAFDNPAGQYLTYNNVGNQGLGGTAPHSILHANNGLGTTTAQGTLTVTAPTSVTAGLYTGVITFTVIGA